MKQLKQTTVLLALALFISFSINAQSEIDQNFSGISAIDISTGSSDCIVKKGTGSEVNVKLDHTFGDDFKPTVEKRGNKLVIKETYKNGSNRGQATWTLTIPNGTDLKFNTGSGDFEATDLEVDLTLNAGSGDFELQDIKGDITSNAGSGDLELQDFSGQLNVNVGSGDLEIENASGQVKLNCGSGDIELSNINATIAANVGSGDISAERVTLAGKGDFNSGSGDVSVDLAATPTSNVSVNSGSGDAHLDFSGNDINGTVIMTANKKNGEIEAPFSFDNVEEIDNGSDHVTVKKTAKLGNSSVVIKIGTGSGTASVSN